MRQNNSQKWIIWSSSQPLCSGYPSSTSVPLGRSWVEQAPRWGSSSNRRFSSTYRPYRRLFTRTAFELYLFPQKRTFVQQLHHSDMGNNKPLLFSCYSPMLSCHKPWKSQSETFRWDLASGNVPLQCCCRSTWANESETLLGSFPVIQLHYFQGYQLYRYAL